MYIISLQLTHKSANENNIKIYSEIAYAFIIVNYLLT